VFFSDSVSFIYVYFSNDSTGAYNVDDDNVVFECEGSRATRLLGTVLMY